MKENDELIIDATTEEIQLLNDFLRSRKEDFVDVPFGFSVGAVTVGGVVHVKNPLEDSWVEGAAIGAINGSFRLDKNNQSAKLYDPTRNILRLVIEISLTQDRFIRGRIDTRRIWDGRWNKGTWIYARF